MSRTSGSTRVHQGVPDPRRRLLALLVVFLLVGALFVAVLVDLQAVRPETYRAVGENQRTRQTELSGYRGAIVDRNGFVFATSTRGHQVVVDPQLVEDPAAVAAALAPALGLDPLVIQERLAPSSAADRHNVVMESIDDETLGLLQIAFDEAPRNLLAGVFVPRQEDRVYPADTLARPIVGVVDPDEQGIYGMEYLFNEDMQGTAGFERVERGIFGSITGGEYLMEPAVQGNDVVLTLDHRIQYVAEESLIRHCEETLAEGASAVVSDPSSGEILAMATVTRNDETGTCYVPNYNAPLVETFEPGSVLKMVTAAAVTEELGWTGDTLVDVPTEIEFLDYTFKEHGNDFVAAPYPIDQIITRSMNLGTIMMAQALGKESLYDYLTAFGFGQHTGIDFKDEARGRLSAPEDWYDSDIGSISFGQGVTVNAVQLNAAYNTIANDGLYIEPSLVRALVDADGDELPLEPQATRTVVSAATADEVTSMLTGVVHSPNGTGTAAAVPGYSVAGKTGTAWKVIQEGPYAGTYGEAGAREYIVSFAGFLPAEDPQLSIVVVVDEPVTQTTAGLVAAPVFADIAQYALRILAIPPAVVVDGSIGSLVQGTPAPAPIIDAGVAVDSSEGGVDEAALGAGQ